MKTQKILLNQFKSKEGVEKSNTVQIHAASNTNHLPPFVKNTVVSQFEQYVKEKFLCEKYKLTLSLNILASNVLFNHNGNNSYQTILDLREFDEDLQEYIQEDIDIIQEENGWFFYNEDESCDKNYLEPTPSRYKLDNPNNWTVNIIYPKYKNHSELLFNGIPISKGMAIITGELVNFNSREMTSLYFSHFHNLEVGDIVRLYDDSDEIIVETEVYSLGTENSKYQTNTILIDYIFDSFVVGFFETTKVYVKKVVNGVECEYYSRWFEEIPTNAAQKKIQKTGFAQNIYTDSVYNLSIDSLDLSEYTDHLNRPLTELFVNLIKAEDSSFWTKVRSGVYNKILGTAYDVNLITNSSTSYIEDNINSNQNIYFGDIVEYNLQTLIETTLIESQYRFNTKNRETYLFLEGSYYTPHKRIKIREFEDTINESLVDNLDYPEYAVNIEGNRVIWKNLKYDVLDDYKQFLNGHYYVYDNIIYPIKRQNPCNLFELGNISVIAPLCPEIEDIDINEPSTIC